jgi:D-lyxose ketol-isomerase
MKRSEINRRIGEAIRFFESMNFKLPPWAFWTPGQWQDHQGDHNEIFENKLGRDLTDFGSGDFKACGLLLVTLRNGRPDMDKKTYAEKVMIVEEDQVTLDGIRDNFQPGDVVRLKPGRSITLFQRLYHTFHGESGSGKVLVGEVSSVNDGHLDNHFFNEAGRFPEIDEDEPIGYLPVGDYGQL